MRQGHGPQDQEERRVSAQLCLPRPAPPLQPSTGGCAGPILLFPRCYLDAGLLHQPLDWALGLEWWPWGCEALWEWAGGGLVRAGLIPWGWMALALCVDGDADPTGR